MNIYLKKGTHTIGFSNPLPKRVTVYFNGQIWLDRDLEGKYKEIKFNTIFDGVYSSETPFRVLKSEPLDEHKSSIKLYSRERERERPIKIVYNPKLGMYSTPARIFTNSNPAIIEVGQKFYTYPPQVRMFILLHEYGHLFYQDEHKTDLFALKIYLNLGLNASQAFYALSKVLHAENPQSLERIRKIFNELKANNYVKN